MPSYRLVGTYTPRKLSTAQMPANARRVQTSKHQGGAISTSPTDRTLGASNRQGWRLACTPEERKAHGSKVTKNTAAFVPSGERVPMRNIQPGKLGRKMMTERTAVN